VGSLESGKLADLVLVDASSPEATPLYDVYSQLVYTLKGSSVRTVVVGGRVVLRDRQSTTLDTAEVLARARAIARKIQPSPR
jgi:5-methylthioadenosine/S-adenosylhomocysteine deaminase